MADNHGTGEDKLKNSGNMGKAKFVAKCKAKYARLPIYACTRVHTCVLVCMRTCNTGTRARTQAHVHACVRARTYRVRARFLKTFH